MFMTADNFVRRTSGGKLTYAQFARPDGVIDLTSTKIKIIPAVRYDKQNVTAEINQHG